MGLCSTCVHMNREQDEFRQQFDDVIVEGDNTVHHFCPMYDDHIPDKIFYADGDCPFYYAKDANDGR